MQPAYPVRPTIDLGSEREADRPIRLIDGWAQPPVIGVSLLPPRRPGSQPDTELLPLLLPLMMCVCLCYLYTHKYQFAASLPRRIKLNLSFVLFSD